jgi:hypothetical protein
MKHPTTISDKLDASSNSIKEWEAIRKIAEKEGNIITIEQAQAVMHFFTTLANIIIDQIIDKQPTIKR